jgi:hypothetical protein
MPQFYVCVCIIVEMERDGSVRKEMERKNMKMGWKKKGLERI